MKRILAILLTLCMTVSMLAGCGGGNSGSTNGGESKAAGTEDKGSPAQSGQSADSGETAAPDGDDAGATSGGTASGTPVYDFSDRDPYTIKVMMFGDADTQACAEISEAISKITREKINADVELTRIGFGTYLTQLNLALSSQEELDLFTPFTTSIATLANTGQIMPITDLLSEYGQETLAAISQSDWACAKVGDDIYSVPANKDKAANFGFNMRKDILDEIGVSVDDIKSFDDLHDVLVKVKEAHPDMYPVVPDGSSMWGILAYDPLGDNLGILDLYADPQSETVVNLYGTDFYREWAERLYQWSQEGLVMPDVASNTESRSNLISSGKGFGGFSHMKPGFDLQESAGTGHEMISWIFDDAVSTTTFVSIGWCIGNNSGDPERTMALLNLMYNDPELANLFCYGIEGVHYEVRDNGKIGYPDGVNSANTPYSRLAWGWPNEQITSIWESDEDTVWTDLAKFNDEARPSPAKGFLFDNSKVLNQITACQNVVGKYHKAIIGGSVEPGPAIEKFLAELESAGIKDIMKEKQAQLDAWLGK